MLKVKITSLNRNCDNIFNSHATCSNKIFTKQKHQRVQTCTNAAKPANLLALAYPRVVKTALKFLNPNHGLSPVLSHPSKDFTRICQQLYNNNNNNNRISIAPYGRNFRGTFSKLSAKFTELPLFHNGQNSVKNSLWIQMTSKI